MWEILRSLLPCKQNSSSTNSLTVNDTEIADPKNISEQFNTFFVNIAKYLAEKLKYTDDTSFISHLGQSSPSSIKVNQGWRTYLLSRATLSLSNEQAGRITF